MTHEIFALIPRCPVILAPMTGITDLPFRQVVARFGAGLVVSEMVASEEVLHGRPLARALAELGFGDRIVATAVNGDFVPARKRAETALSEGDRIEVVAPMQGG